MQDWLWKAAQIAVFCGLVVLIYEGWGREEAQKADGPVMLAVMIISLALTALIFAPFLHLKAWLLSRRAAARQDGLKQQHTRIDASPSG